MSIISRLCHYSTSILSPNSSTPLTSKQKTRNALHLLKSETNPKRILDICNADALTPDFQLDRRALSLAVSKLAAAHHFTDIHTFVDDLKTRPDLCRNEKFLSHSVVLYGQANMLDHAIHTFAEDLPSPRSVKTLNPSFSPPSSQGRGRSRTGNGSARVVLSLERGRDVTFPVAGATAAPLKRTAIPLLVVAHACAAPFRD